MNKFYKHKNYKAIRNRQFGPMMSNNGLDDSRKVDEKQREAYLTMRYRT